MLGVVHVCASTTEVSAVCDLSERGAVRRKPKSSNWPTVRKLLTQSEVSAVVIVTPQKYLPSSLKIITKN